MIVRTEVRSHYLAPEEPKELLVKVFDASNKLLWGRALRQMACLKIMVKNAERNNHNFSLKWVVSRKIGGLVCLVMPYLNDMVGTSQTIAIYS